LFELISQKNTFTVKSGKCKCYLTYFDKLQTATAYSTGDIGMHFDFSNYCTTASSEADRFKKKCY